MPLPIGDEPEAVSPLRRFAPWARRIIIGIGLVWIAYSLQNFSEDTRTHTIKVSFPLLMNYEWITAPQPGYNPKQAVWKPVASAFPVADGTVLFVKTGAAVYAVKISNQKIQPETADYEFLRVGSTDPIAKGVAQTFPDGVPLPGCTVGWSGKSAGAGFLYLDDAFIWNKTARYTIGVPFQDGDLENFRKAVPAAIHFESRPWKIVDDSTDEAAPLR